MPLQKEIIDNSEGNELISFLNSALNDNPDTKFDIVMDFSNKLKLIAIDFIS